MCVLEGPIRHTGAVAIPDGLDHHFKGPVELDMLENPRLWEGAQVRREVRWGRLDGDGVDHVGVAMIQGEGSLCADGAGTG